MQVALRVRDADAFLVVALLDLFSQLTACGEPVGIADMAADAKVDAALGQFIDEDRRLRFGQHARVGLHCLHRDGARLVDVVGIADPDDELDAAHRVRRQVDDRVVGDQRIGQGDHLIVGAAQPGLEDADHLDLAGHAVDGDDVIDMERPQGDQHYARGDVRQRILEGEANRQAGRAKHREHRGHRYAQHLHDGQQQDHLQHHQDDAAKEQCRGRLDLALVELAADPGRQHARELEADQQQDQGAEQAPADRYSEIHPFGMFGSVEPIHHRDLLSDQGTKRPRAHGRSV